MPWNFVILNQIWDAISLWGPSSVFVTDMNLFLFSFKVITQVSVYCGRNKFSLMEIPNHNSNVKSFSRSVFSGPNIPPFEKIVSKHRPGISWPDILDNAVNPDRYNSRGILQSLCLSRWLLMYLAFFSNWSLQTHFLY